MLRVDVIKAETCKEITDGVRNVLRAQYTDLLPGNMNAKILLKPNLNANMNALTGNTTDLRLLAAVIGFLKENGYTDITVGEGTNSGYYRNKISVISRLRIDALVKHYGVTVKDFNYAEPFEIDFENGIKAAVARDCVEADLFINMPKVKTHFEAGMSACLKNLMGCLIGQENKKKTHQSLSANIVNINRALKPHLHIADGIISMEGLGPTRGTPIKTGMIFVGTDPYLIDLLCAKMANFPHGNVRTLVEARRRGLLTDEHLKIADAMKFDRKFTFKPPVAGPIANFIHSPKRQKYFLAIRNTPVFNYLCSTGLGGKILYATGLRQDVFRDDEMVFKGLGLDENLCDRCGKCADYCPVGIKLPDSLMGDNAECIGCLYCYCVCPKIAIKFIGTMGFMDEQMKQYDNIIRKTT